nr:capsid protein [Rat picobirnavirus]
MGQSRKDSREKRVNYDNTRVDKFKKDMKRTNNKRRGATSRRSYKAKDVTESDTRTAVDSTNDVSWYAHTPELLRAAASVPFSVVNGQMLPTDRYPDPGQQPDYERYSIPNTLALHWEPTISGMGAEAINQAADSMYSYVVHANSRNYRYNAPDLMILVLAAASFFSMLAHGIRTYGIMRLYDQRNKFLPDDWIMLSGFDPANLKSNMSRMWFDLNQLIAMSQQIWIPNTMPVITRWFWLNSNIYMDANSAKAQYYMFVPSSYYQYSETGDEHGGCLLLYNWKDPENSSATKQIYKTWDQYMAIMQAMLTNLINSEDRGIIFGDILKAYGADRIYSVSSITSDYTVTPVYNAEVLTQIENSTVWSFRSTSNSIFNDRAGTRVYGGVYQNQDTVRLVEKFTWQLVSLMTDATDKIRHRLPMIGRPILNFHQQALPTPEQVMVATRLMSVGIQTTLYENLGTTSAPQNGVWLAPIACGTEIITDVSCSVYYQKVQNGKLVSTLGILDMMMQQDQSVIFASNQGYGLGISILSAWSAFDWAPIFYVRSNRGISITAAELQSASWKFTRDPIFIFCDYDNWTELDTGVLSKMHTAAIYSEFGVPVIL